LGLKNNYFVGKVGSKGYVSAILNKRKPLTLDLARFFHNELGIPADIFIC
jgi:HTH-type transcriptional regulator / antitoxin HigA